MTSPEQLKGRARHLRHIVKALAAESFSRIRDARHVGMTFALRDVSRLLGRSHHTCRIRDIGQIVLRLGTSDAGIFQQVFRDREYDITWYAQATRMIAAYQDILARNKRPLIIDCGANNGASSLWFANWFPEAKIVAVEPDCGNAEVCRFNTRDRPVEVLVAAIGSSDGVVRIVDGGGETSAFQTRRDHTGGTPLTTVPDIVEANGDDVELFIVKVDIEGFESDLFSSNTGWVDDVTAIFIEPHDWMLPGQATSRNFQAVMAQQEFDLLVCGENLIYVR